MIRYFKFIYVRLLGGLKGIFLIAAVGIGLFLHFYTENIINHLREEARSLVVVYASMYARVGDTESTSGLRFIFEEVIQRTNFPIIQTDPDNNPVSWKGISVDPNDRSHEALLEVRSMVKRLSRGFKPIPVKYKDLLLGYLYYGDSSLINQLKWLPYVEIGIIGIFIMVGFIGYANIKKSEQRNIWVGMAKETAHQLGTPLSSLMGWLEVMKTGKAVSRDQVLDEMDQDLKRLRRVTQRFSLISSRPNLVEMDLAGLLAEAAKYIRRRTPQMGRCVKINEDYQDVPKLKINSNLFSWVIENMLKNSLDAMDKENGVINIRLMNNKTKNKVFLDIEDNGKGIEHSDVTRIFKPGFSTKKRGWGLGLSLAKRIVGDYHGGRLYVKESKPDQGTVMRIELNV